jgi:serine/threonine protein kinase
VAAALDLPVPTTHGRLVTSSDRESPPLGRATPRGGHPAKVAGPRLGPYQIIALLGSGGMGMVYRARDDRLRRDVAIKLLAPEVLTDEAARERFRIEALALAKLNHPNIR